MLRLINQLLEFRKMQNNKLSLMLEETDVMVFFMIFIEVSRKRQMTNRLIFILLLLRHLIRCLLIKVNWIK